MSYLASPNANSVYYSYSPMDSLVDVMMPLVSSIRDYNPHFKESYQTLLGKLPAILTKDTSAIEQFTAVLRSVSNKIVDIKNKAFMTRDKLANIRDQLALSIRNTQTKLDELSAEKEGLIGQKQVLERQIQAKKDEIDSYMTLFWIFSWIIALILEGIKPFDAALNKLKIKLATKQQAIEHLNNNIKSEQQFLNQSLELFNFNQRLCTQCDVIQNNITNIQSSLKRLDVESHFLTAKLMTLEKDWSGLMAIVNQHGHNLLFQPFS